VVIAVSAWVPVVGTIGGVLAGGLVTGLIERARWKREDRTRWYEDRCDTYANFLQAAAEFSRTQTQLAEAAAALDRAPDERQFNEAIADVDKSVARAKASLDALLPFQYPISLIAGPKVREAAKRVVDLARDQALIEIDAKERVSETQDARKALQEALVDFRIKARDEIGVEE
jgi:hypothetical protein